MEGGWAETPPAPKGQGRNGNAEPEESDDKRWNVLDPVKHLRGDADRSPKHCRETHKGWTDYSLTVISGRSSHGMLHHVTLSKSPTAPRTDCLMPAREGAGAGSATSATN